MTCLLKVKGPKSEGARIAASAPAQRMKRNVRLCYIDSVEPTMISPNGWRSVRTRDRCAKAQAGSVPSPSLSNRANASARRFCSLERAESSGMAACERLRALDSQQGSRSRGQNITALVRHGRQYLRSNRRNARPEKQRSILMRLSDALAHACAICAAAGSSMVFCWLHTSPPPGQVSQDRPPAFTLQSTS